MTTARFRWSRSNPTPLTARSRLRGPRRLLAEDDDAQLALGQRDDLLAVGLYDVRLVYALLLYVRGRVVDVGNGRSCPLTGAPIAPPVRPYGPTVFTACGFRWARTWPRRRIRRPGAACGAADVDAAARVAPASSASNGVTELPSCSTSLRRRRAFCHTVYLGRGRHTNVATTNPVVGGAPGQSTSAACRFDSRPPASPSPYL